MAAAKIAQRRSGLQASGTLGPYILDFYCFAARLVVEVDGSTHDLDDQAQKDERRDRWLEGDGLFVYRIPAAEVYRDPDGVADGIILQAAGRIDDRKQ